MFLSELQDWLGELVIQSGRSGLISSFFHCLLYLLSSFILIIMKNELTELITDFKGARRKALFTKSDIIYQLEKLLWLVATVSN